MRIPRLIVTSGEPAGIGPDLCLAIAGREWPCDVVVAADIELLKQRAQQLRLNIRLLPYVSSTICPAHQPGTLRVLHVPTAEPVEPGKLNVANAHYVLNLLDAAAQGCLTGEFDAMVTAPVQKSVINDAGVPFSGHTEYLAEHTGGSYPVMMLATETLRVALATTHLPLQDVSAAITDELLSRVIRIIDHDLRTRFDIPAPRILVCGLNPHAGESGHLGREEIEVIAPTLERLRQQGLQLIGPAPADTAFTPHMLQQADAVLAMFHDQGLPVIKFAGFGDCVNITLGLPIVRTSVDHGTALSLAGSGQADASSLATAMQMALRMTHAPTSQAIRPALPA
ncbi:4-hydroxythreonine-4-phosphate dehydrogenase PdxA [Steroidobacter sp. S1-65]|uniref:4-hydroxythreonine-4-phosphate dehydrogenase n=1 Tax=Steroidobacter gossypii TaxID=2805490 RepID=A0ABS1X5G3_9GAMM|nr:4-hydroxythreonine-4-phosphate dehydrogenase PdxA [Steroidobacter gossypii]MBM0108468.1 4-hydroxythreonine-4-phosphate dehydrogenase PdxA [Steroidobacter gossypii]